MPHVVGGMDDSKDNDTKIAMQLCDNDKRLNMAPLFKDPIQAKSYISEFDLFLGSRMHATIAALSSGVPTIPLAYSRKFRGVFEPLGYDETINLSEMDEDEIIEQIKFVIDNIDVVIAKTNTIRDTALTKFSVYEKYLKDELKKYKYEMINGG